MLGPLLGKSAILFHAKHQHRTRDVELFEAHEAADAGRQRAQAVPGHREPLQALKAAERVGERVEEVDVEEEDLQRRSERWVS